MPDTYWPAMIRLHPEDVKTKMREAHRVADGVATKAAELLGMELRSWYNYAARLGIAGDLRATGKGRRADAAGANGPSRVRKSGALEKSRA